MSARGIVGEYKAKVPCKEYWGNVCSGFGGSLTCHKCGWERHEHDYERYHAKHRADKDPETLEWWEEYG